METPAIYGGRRFDPGDCDMAVRSMGTAAAAGCCLTAGAAYFAAPAGIEPALAAGASVLLTACLGLAAGWRAAAARSPRLAGEVAGLHRTIADAERRHADALAAHEARHARATERDAAREAAEREREAAQERERSADAQMRETAKNKRIAIEQEKAREAAK